MQWEYKTIKLATKGLLGGKLNTDKLDAFMNDLGAAGWELPVSTRTEPMGKRETSLPCSSGCARNPYGIAGSNRQRRPRLPNHVQANGKSRLERPFKDKLSHQFKRFRANPIRQIDGKIDCRLGALPGPALGVL